MMSLKSPVRSPKQELGARVQAVYAEQLHHQPQIIGSNIFDRQLAVMLEDAVTKPEQLLIDHGHVALARQVRDSINDILYPKLSHVIEEVLGVAVVYLLVATQLETGFTSVTAVLNKSSG